MIYNKHDTIFFTTLPNIIHNDIAIMHCPVTSLSQLASVSLVLSLLSSPRSSSGAETDQSLSD